MADSNAAPAVSQFAWQVTKTKTTYKLAGKLLDFVSERMDETSNISSEDKEELFNDVRDLISSNFYAKKRYRDQQTLRYWKNKARAKN